jgi:hypothetical protein
VFLLCLFPALRRHLSILRFLCPQTFIFVSTIIVKRGGVGEMKTEKRSKPDHLRRPRVTARLSCLRHKALIASSPIFSPPPFPSLSVSFAVSLSLCLLNLQWPSNCWRLFFVFVAYCSSVHPARYFYGTFAFEMYFYGIYIYGIYFYRSLIFLNIDCTVVRNTWNASIHEGKM